MIVWVYLYSNLCSRPRHCKLQNTHRRSGPTGTPPKLGWNMARVQKPAISLKRCKIEIGPWYYDRLIGSRICAFDSYQNQWPWMTLKRPKRTFAEKNAFYGAHQKNLNEDRPILSVEIFRSVILVSRNIRYMRIFAGVPQGGGVKRHWGRRRRYFLAISVATASETFDRRQALSAVCRQGPTRKPCCGRRTSRCRCKTRYVSKFTAASHGSPCDSTAFLS